MLLDVQMPGMDGFETAELIKGRERTRTVPIIFVTAISKEREHVFRGYSAGAVDYVFKPYDPTILRSKVAVFLELDAKSRAAAQQRGDPARGVRLRADRHGAAGPRGPHRRGQPRARGAARPAAGRPARPAASRTSCTATTPRRRATGAARCWPAARALRARGALLVRADGEAIPCRLSFSRARPGAGVPDVIVVQVQDLRERRRAEAEREQLMREQAARAQAERTAERLQAVQRITDAALGTLALRRRSCASCSSASIEVLGGRHRRGRARRGRRHDRRLPGGRRRRRRRCAQAPPTPAAPDDGRHPARVAARRRGGVDARGAAASSTARRSARCTSARCSRASFTDDHRGAAAARRRPRRRWRSSAHGCSSASTAIAEELQRSLLPARAAAACPGSRSRRATSPAGAGSQVGGDWYDAVVQPDGRLLLIVGDVAGRGIARGVDDGAAAQRAARVRVRRPLAGVAARAAERVPDRPARPRHDDRRRSSRVDPDARRRCATRKAGHPPALLVDADGRAIWLDDAAGPAARRARRSRVHRGPARARAGLDARALHATGSSSCAASRWTAASSGSRAATVAAPDDDRRAVRHVARGHARRPRRRRRRHAAGACAMAGARRRAVGDPFPRRRTDLLARQLRGGTWPHERAALGRGRAARAACRPARPRAASSPTRWPSVASKPELDDLLIVVTELVNNAVVHGGADRSGRARARARRRRRRAAAGRGLQPRRRVRAAPAVRRSRSPAGSGCSSSTSSRSRWGDRRRRRLLRVVRDRPRGGRRERTRIE